MPSFPADPSGNPIPCLAPVYGSSLEAAVGVGTGTAMAINAGGNACLVTIFAIGCPCFYRSGVAAVGVPTLADGFLFADSSKDVPMPSGHTHMRIVAKSGSGTGRVEYLG